MASSLSEYYHQNYTRNCQKLEKAFLEAPEFLAVGAKIIGVIGIPSNFFAYYIIIFHTPKSMDHLKLCLLNLKFWTLLIDLVYTVFLIPYVFYPIFAMGYIGIFGKLLGMPAEIQFYLAMCCYGGISSAGIMIFENRQHFMIPKGYKFRIQNQFYRALLVVFNSFTGLSVMLMAIWLRGDGDDLKLKFLKFNPCPDPLYFTPYTFAVDSNRNEFSICILIVLTAISIQYSFFISHCIWYIYSEEAARYSRSTRKMQKMFLFASFSQLAIFLTVFVLPLGVFAFILTTGYINQGLLNICNLIIPTIGINTTIGLVVMYKPYRDYLIKKLRKQRRNCGIVNSPSVFTKSVVF